MFMKLLTIIVLSAGIHAGAYAQEGTEPSGGGGESLPEETQSGAEESVTEDVSSVRVHSGSNANSNNTGARAVTSGNSVTFGGNSAGGERGGGLAAQELAHVVQQSTSTSDADEASNMHQEPRLSTDFSGVRVHTDGAASEMNCDLDSEAFATGGRRYPDRATLQQRRDRQRTQATQANGQNEVAGETESRKCANTDDAQPRHRRPRD